MGKFVVRTGINSQYYFSLKADNGQKILSSEGYTTKSACLNGVEAVKVNARDDNRYDKKTASNGKYYFNLKASNGQIIGISEMYEAEAGRNGGIASVKSNAPFANVVEE